MPSIDFYVLEDSSKQQSLHFACQWIEKAYLAREQVYVHTASLEEAERLDMLLWTFRDDSFLPHGLYSPADDLSLPIQIGYEEGLPPSQQGVLLNLTPTIPAFYHQFDRVIEIVFSDPSVQELARDRFRQYRERGEKLNTYKVKPSWMK